ncbi:MAG TPA: hypothetical protein VGG64_08895 [Pirellulales bacterium]|jgi:hypothetical protein
MTGTAKRPGKQAALEAAGAWIALEARRVEAKRAVDAIEREQKLHLQVCAERLGEEESEKLSAKISLALKWGSPRVEWKDEVIRLQGADYAAELQKQGKRSSKVEIKVTE